MADSALRQQIIQQIDQLTPAQQQQLLAYAMQIRGTMPDGIRGEDLIALAHEINFPAEDIAEIMRAIEADTKELG